MKAFLDTHAAVALAEGRVEVFGPVSTDLLERSALFVSPILRLELAFLHELGRTAVEPDELLGHLAATCGAVQSEDPIQAVVAHAMRLTWTRDPFDRMLVATALLHRAPLITRDETIRAHFADAVW